MNKTLIPIFVILQTYASVLPANNIDRADVAQLEKQTKRQIQECADVISNQRINSKSSFDAIAEIFTTRYPEICVQTGLDWYQRQLTELAVSQKELDDQMFRANLAILLSEFVAFKADFEPRSQLSGGSISEYSTLSSKSADEPPEIPSVRGYTTLSGD